MKIPGSLRRPVRRRLALAYSGLFLLAGTVLLAVTYGLVANSLSTAANSNPALAGASPSALTTSKLARACKSGQVAAYLVEKCKYTAEQAFTNGAKAGAASARAQTLDHLLSFSVATLAIMTLLSAALGWIIAGRALRPVHAITAAARRASEQNLTERIALTGPPDELKELADTFDAMLARLDAAFASQRRFVANASHELRTPLTVMRTAIDVTLAKPSRTPQQLEAMATEVRHAVEHAEAMIEALLALARSDRGQGPRAELDMAAFAENAIDAAEQAISERSLRVTTALEPGIMVGDPALVERLVANLVDNAVRHNVRDGWIEVSTGSRDGMAYVCVANSGPVIEETDIPSLFEPFHRRYPQQETVGSEGAGLGLSIVASVAAAHNGRVTAWPPPGGGLAVVVVLPALYAGACPGAFDVRVRGRRPPHGAGRRSSSLPERPDASRAGRRRTCRQAAS